MKRNILFTKMSGAGNDFIVIDNRDGAYSFLGEAEIRQLCTRRIGIGADGLLMLEGSENHDFAMRYYNADGRLGSMCGNGGRCIAQFGWKLGDAAKKELKFEANGNTYFASVLADGEIKLNMLVPKDFRDAFSVDGHECVFVDTGSPHAILYVENLDETHVVEIGQKIRHNQEHFPGGTNVNFVQILSSEKIRVRTFERGVEDETLACGTGAVASALMSYRLGKVSAKSVCVAVQSGDLLTIAFDEEMQHVTLSGPALEVFQGEVSESFWHK
ncbi:Diaminopimelate epimerase [Chloroherpeton thalassium ATCC 35110]|uniref:Diaminopimelate epimerase n=1 Tax=Chloroherpeton thalassium (strain ATCC 35110 / GB-78) TaxID=517418 RepID=B3QXC3_CHLT3|nr:diaminopimelate epimerase [Chloroherpeton thalassium]ACF13397.1 Diaminopimelate epimerase [Chloroherpeton thalassium ATCC 35110]